MAGIGLSGAVSGIAFGLGVIEGQVARVLILFYLAPVWSVLMARFVLREPLTPVTLPALAVALVGAAMMLIGGDRGALAGLAPADALGLVAGLAFAATNLQLRAGRALPLSLKALASAYLAPPLALIAAMLLDVPLTASPSVIGSALLLGASWMSAMIVAVQIGVRALPLQRSSVLLLFELVVGAVSAALIAGEALGPWELAGGLGIVGAGLAVVRSGSASRPGRRR
jgi:drug/metabolite transporter (DMT)-like permease